MKKILLLIIIGLFLNIHLLSQKSEYRYSALKFGFTSGFNSKPQMNPNKYLMTRDNQEMQLSPTGSAYVPGFTFAFLYHFDFSTNNAGIYTGLEYNYGGIGAKYGTTYQTKDIYYTMKETIRYHSLGIPIAFKYGPDMWNTQRYLVVGAQLNFNLAMKSFQKVSWTKDLAGIKLTPDEYNRIAFSLFAGVNFRAFNVQLDVYPNTLFNKTYTAASGYKPYTGEPDKSFVLKTTINVPYGWLSQKSYWWRKVLRDTFWR